MSVGLSYPVLSNTLNTKRFRRKITAMDPKKFTPRPPLNTTLEQRAEMIAYLDKAAKNRALSPETRMLRKKRAWQLRQIQAKRVQQRDAGTNEAEES